MLRPIQNNKIVSSDPEITIELLTKLSMEFIKKHSGSDCVSPGIILDIVRLSSLYQRYIETNPISLTLVKYDIESLLKKESKTSSGFCCPSKKQSLIQYPKTETSKLYNLIMNNHNPDSLPHTEEIQRLCRSQLTNRYLMPHLVADTLMIVNSMMCLQQNGYKPQDITDIFTKLLGTLSKDMENFKLDSATMLSALSLTI